MAGPAPAQNIVIPPAPPSQAALQAEHDRIMQAEQLTRRPPGTRSTILSQPNVLNNNPGKTQLGQ